MEVLVIGLNVPLLEKLILRQIYKIQKYAKWDNKQHISLLAFLNGIATTFTM